MVVRRQLRYGNRRGNAKKTDGSLGDAADVQSIPTSPLGPHQAQDGPRYRFADSGHDAPHSHMTQTDPAGNLLAVPHRQAVNAVLEVALAGATASCREYSYPPQRMWRRCRARRSLRCSPIPTTADHRCVPTGQERARRSQGKSSCETPLPPFAISCAIASPVGLAGSSLWIVHYNRT